VEEGKTKNYPGSLLRISRTPGPFQCCAACSSSLQMPTIWTKFTDPNGVWAVPSCGSAVISICWMRDSLLSSALCHETWSPAQSVLAGKQTEIFQILPYRMTCNPQFKLPQRGQITMKGDWPPGFICRRLVSWKRQPVTFHCQSKQMLVLYIKALYKCFLSHPSKFTIQEWNVWRNGNHHNYAFPSNL
jgi:hypothetical protein